MTTPLEPATRREFDALLSRAGLAIVPERYEGACANYAEMRRLAEVVRRHALLPEDEPANVFGLPSLMRLDRCA